MIVLSPSGYSILCNHAFHTLNIVFSHKSRPSDVYVTSQSWLWVKSFQPRLILNFLCLLALGKDTKKIENSTHLG